MILIIYPLFKSWLERQNEALYRNEKKKDEQANSQLTITNNKTSKILFKICL